MDIERINQWITEQEYHQKILIEKIMAEETELEYLKLFIEELRESAEVIKYAAVVTQKQVEYSIAEAGTLALQSIFENDMEIGVHFGTKRNQTECVITFVKNGFFFSPSDESGQGAADIAGFGLRVALWSLPAHRSSPILMMDEKFKHLKGEKANISAIQAVKELSKEHGIQIIMVSDERVPFEEIEKGADCVMKVVSKENKPHLQILK
jgi:hypothetical protein